MSNIGVTDLADEIYKARVVGASLHLATVVSIETNTVSVRVDGSTTVTSGVAYVKYAPIVNQTVLVWKEGPSLTVWGVPGSTSSVPSGVIEMFGSNTPPAGYLLCDGQSTAGYPNLASVVGANVPDLRNKFIVGVGSDYGLGSTGGAASNTTVPTHAHNGPSHEHTQPTHTHSQPSHTHTQPSHTHTQPSHSHTGPSHSHTQPSHTHTAPDHQHPPGGHVHYEFGEGKFITTGATGDLYSVVKGSDPPASTDYGFKAQPGTTGPSQDGYTGMGGATPTAAGGADNTGLDGTGATGSSGSDTTGSAGSETTGSSGSDTTGSSGNDTTGSSGTATTSETGAASVENRPPYYALTYIIKT